MVPVTDERRAAHLEVGAGAARRLDAALQRRQGHVGDVARRGERVRVHAVGHLTAQLGHRLADRGEKIRGVPYGLVSGTNIGVMSVCR